MQSNKEYKRVWRFFNIADYDKEEQWLNDMAAAGWNFVRVQGGVRFTFKRGVPGEYIYKLDMVERNASDEVKESYYNFLTECNIRVVGDYNDWIYLQRRASDGPFDVKDEAYTKLRRLNKVYSFSIRMVCRLLILFSLMVIGFSLLSLATTGYQIQEVFDGVVRGVSIASLIALSIIWVPIVTRLRRRINALIDDVGVNR